MTSRASARPASAAPRPQTEDKTWHLSGFAHCPVLVVNNGWRWADPMSALPQQAPVVVGVDGSPSSWRALAFGYGEAAARHVPLVALHAGRAKPHDAVAAELEPWLRRHPEVRTRFLARDTGVLDALSEAAAPRCWWWSGRTGPPGTSTRAPTR